MDGADMRCAHVCDSEISGLIISNLDAVTGQPEQASPSKLEIVDVEELLWLAGTRPIEMIAQRFSTRVMMDRAGLVVTAAFPSIHTRSSMARSREFITTAAIVPSGFRKAAVRRSSAFEEQMIRRAPGRMNFEK